MTKTEQLICYLAQKNPGISSWELGKALGNIDIQAYIKLGKSITGFRYKLISHSGESIIGPIGLGTILQSLNSRGITKALAGPWSHPLGDGEVSVYYEGDITFNWSDEEYSIISNITNIYSDQVQKAITFLVKAFENESIPLSIFLMDFSEVKTEEVELCSIV